ncbi:glycoside hydrolase family 5 protein [Bosea sp. NPDC055594]
MRQIVLALGLLLSLAAFAAANSPTPGQVRIVGETIERDGKRWNMKGAQVAGRLTPKDRLSVVAPALTIAHNQFGPSLLDKIVAFGADTVVLKVSLPALNEKSEYFRPEYLRVVTDAVDLIRERGLTVIISMQWQSGSGSYKETGLPDQTASNAWRRLFTALQKDDHGLLFELLNEPKGDGLKQADWLVWQKHFNRLIAEVRAQGFNQVVVINGLTGAHVLEGAPPLTDSANQIAYGVHPYFNSKRLPSFGPPMWEGYFGGFCRQHICLATEWNASKGWEGRPSAGCAGDVPRISRELLRYLKSLGMGIAGWAFDYPGTIFKDDDLTELTTYDSWAGGCGASEGPIGAGKLLRDWFHANP